jgi:hypothetical protein
MPAMLRKCGKTPKQANHHPQKFDAADAADAPAVELPLDPKSMERYAGEPLGGFGPGDDDDLDVPSFDPAERDILADFGLDDEEAYPEVNDFPFDDSDRVDD